MNWIFCCLFLCVGVWPEDAPLIFFTNAKLAATEKPYPPNMYIVSKENLKEVLGPILSKLPQYQFEYDKIREKFGKMSLQQSEKSEETVE